MSDTPAPMASSSIFWIYLTTGASSTSAAFLVGRLVARVDLAAKLVVADEVLEGLAQSFDDLLDRLAELVVLDHHRVDHEVGLEAHLLECLQVGRVGDRDKQAVAALVQRQDASRRGDLGVDELLVDLVEVEGRQIEQRRAEGARREDRDLRRTHLLAEEDLLDKTDAAGLCLRLQRVGVVFAQ